MTLNNLYWRMYYWLRHFILRLPPRPNDRVPSARVARPDEILMAEYGNDFSDSANEMPKPATAEK